MPYCNRTFEVTQKTHFRSNETRQLRKQYLQTMLSTVVALSRLIRPAILDIPF